MAAVDDDDDANRGFRMVARPNHINNVVTGGTMLSTVPLLNANDAAPQYAVTMSMFRRVEDIFSDNSFVDQHLNFQRQINLEYLQNVYNRREPIGFGTGPEGQVYIFLSSLGMLIPVEVLNISPNEFTGRMAAEIGEFLDVMHATILINSFSEPANRQEEATHVVEFDKLHQTRYKKMYKEDFEMCTICQEDFKSNEKIVILHNQHAFHRDCIKTWLKQKPCCPNCNAIVPHKTCGGGPPSLVFTV